MARLVIEVTEDDRGSPRPLERVVYRGQGETYNESKPNPLITLWDKTKEFIILLAALAGFYVMVEGVEDDLNESIGGLTSQFQSFKDSYGDDKLEHIEKYHMRNDDGKSGP